MNGQTRIPLRREHGFPRFSIVFMELGLRSTLGVRVECSVGDGSAPRRVPKRCRCCVRGFLADNLLLGFGSGTIIVGDDDRDGW